MAEIANSIAKNGIYEYTMKTGFIKYLILPIILIIIGCSPIRKTIITEKVEVVQRDSTVIKDSIVITPVEKIVDIVPIYDTLYMETSLAKAKAYVDTNIHIIKGNLENKQQLIKKIEYRDKYAFRDSLVYKEVPVEVEKPVKYTPKFIKGLAIVGIISILLFILMIVKKFTT